jgi:O-antigen/teichoic acid export membrane protein
MNLINKLKSNTLIKNMSWLGISEIIIRIFKLAVTLTLPRLLSSQDYGIFAIAFTLQEFMTVLEGRSGFNSKLIQCKDYELSYLCNTTYSLSWIIAICTFFLQIILGLLLSNFYSEPKLILPIIILAFSYFTYPLYNIQGALIYRNNNLKPLAITKTIQGCITNILTIVLALLGANYWSFIIPSIIGSLIWTVSIRKFQQWQPSEFTFKHSKELIQFGLPLMGVELLSKIRNYLDYIIVGAILGIQQLGIYFFAFNAGLGLSLSVIDTFTNSFYPNLASKSSWREIKSTFWSGFKTISIILVPLVILQSSLAPFYVPLIFGPKWIPAIPILIFICLSAIPRPLKSMADSILKLNNNTTIILKADLLFSILFSISVTFSSYSNINMVSFSVCLIHWVFIPIYFLIVIRMLNND